MPERISPEARSAIMRAVKSAGSASESKLRDVLSQLGRPVREQATDLPGRPDFVLDDLRLAVFLDGDFWHGRDWFERRQAPMRNRGYWVAKFERNRDRHRVATLRLRRRGWSVLRFWESELLRDPQHASSALVRRVARLETAARGRRATGRPPRESEARM